jgi:vacuolar-type H+-ATPase subunit I/STV1
MKRIISTLTVVFIVVLVLSDCASPPIEEMQRARDAVIRAESDADAVAYAGNFIIRARDALTRMQSEADSKRYDAAKEFAAEAILNAERAIAEGRSAKERSRSEAAALLDSIQNLLTETQNAINNARGIPNILLDFDALTQDMDQALMIYNEAWQSFQAGDYLDAVTKAQSVRALLSYINTRINEAAFDTSRKQ